jgi:hypothetical protein
VEVGATQGRLVCARGLADGTDVGELDADTVCMKVGAALGKLGNALGGDDKICVEVGAALGKLIDGLDRDTVCLHQDMCRKTQKLYQ